MTEKGLEIYNKLVEIKDIFDDVVKNNDNYINILSKCCKAHLRLIFDTDHQKLKIICERCQKSVKIGIKCFKCGDSDIKIEYS